MSLLVLGLVLREEARLGEVRGERDEQWHDQDQLAEELGAREGERDGHVRRAAPLVELELERDRDVSVDGSE